MGTLVFVCPTTGHEVSTGVEVDRSNYKRLSRTKTAVFCPRCRKNHMLAATPRTRAGFGCVEQWVDTNCAGEIIRRSLAGRCEPLHLISIIHSFVLAWLT